MNARDLCPPPARTLDAELLRLGIQAATGPKDQSQWQALVQRVEQRLAEADRNLYLLERAQALAALETDEAIQALNEHASALRTSEARLNSLLGLSADWVWETDHEQRLVFVSDGLCSCLGLPREALLGRSVDATLHFERDSGAEREFRERTQQRAPFRDLPLRLLDIHGQERHLLLSGAPHVTAAGAFAGYRGVGRDVTEATRVAQQMRTLAERDALTGLLNRTGVLLRLEERLAAAREHAHPLAVLLVGLDRFQSINQSLGHRAGDQMLMATSRRIKATVRDGDIVGRIGSDEFVVIIDSPASPAASLSVARKLLASIAQPVDLTGHLVRITGSIGIAGVPGDGQSVNELLAAAGRALQAAKRAGRNTVRSVSASDGPSNRDDATIEVELIRALEQRELVLHYQPQVDACDSRLVGVEALVRWQHPTRGLVMPMDFVPVAEDRGLSDRLDHWVLEEACRQLALWQAAGHRLPRVAVNISPRTFSDARLPQRVRLACQRHGVEPSLIELELTERVLLETPDHTLKALNELRDLGVRIAIDDFGTGYSSLAYLKSIRPQLLKIDRSFVRGLPQDDDDRSITSAIIGLAKNLRLEVVAEGVETDAQRDWLAGMACDVLQGYRFGKPVPASALLLERDAP